MLEKSLTKEEWTEALKGLQSAYKVFVPVKEGDFHNFRLLKNGAKPSFDFQNTRLSPKAVIFPQSERMFEYSLDESKEDAHIIKETPKDFSAQAIVGIRPCDALAFQLVRINFDNPQYQDPWWVQRMDATTLIGFACNDPCASCFCTSVGSGPFSEKGLDALMVDLGDRFVVKSLTTKGEALLKSSHPERMQAAPSLSRCRIWPKPRRRRSPPRFRRIISRTRWGMSCFTLLFGRGFLLPASTVEPAPISARRVGASTSRMKFAKRKVTGSATGMPVCSPFSPITAPATIPGTKNSSG
jgi:hypothetical protein